MRYLRTHVALGAMVVVVLAAACSGDEGRSGPPSDNGPSTTAATPGADGPGGSVAMGFTGRVWRVVGVVEGDVVQPPPPGVEATLLVEDGRISGSAGCNEYSGPVEVEGSSLRVGNVSITERGCVETVDWLTFLDTLMRARSATQVGDGYVIEAVPEGAIVLQ